MLHQAELHDAAYCHAYLSNLYICKYERAKKRITKGGFIFLMSV